MENKGAFNRIAQKFFKKPEITQVHVDEIGSFIWPLIDGEKNVSEIADLLSAEFGEKTNPLYSRIIEYFRIFKANDFISFKKM